MTDQFAIIRDDDTGYFSKIEMLERVYGNLWARGIPVSLAVIPAHQGATRVAFRRGRPYDPSVPPKFRGTREERPVTDNPALCAFLNEKAKQGLVEIMLHGYNHSYMEFLTEDASVIGEKLGHGMDILHRAFPDVPIRTFIAPYDRMSPVAMRMVLNLGLNFCTASSNLSAAPELPPLEGYAHQAIPNGRMIFTCDEYLFHRVMEPAFSTYMANDRLKTAPTLIMANHYWMFWKNWETPNDPMLAAWDEFADRLLSSPRQVTTFAGLASTVR